MTTVYRMIAAIGFGWNMMAFVLSLSLMHGKPVDNTKYGLGVAYEATSYGLGVAFNVAYDWTAYGASIAYTEGGKFYVVMTGGTGQYRTNYPGYAVAVNDEVELPNINKTAAGSFMISFVSFQTSMNPLVQQRMLLGGHKLSRAKKYHFYALALAELGPNGTIEDYAALIETAYNRSVTEKDNSVTENLKKSYYQPLRKYRTKKYRKTIYYKRKGKKRKKRVWRTRKIKTAGWKNYVRYKSKLQADGKLYAKLDKAHTLVLNGSNYSGLATQNASAQVAASARKTQTVTLVTTTGETLSRKDLMAYKKKHGENTIINTQIWVKRTEEQLAAYSKLAKASRDKKRKVDYIEKYELVAKTAKSYLKTISTGGAAGSEGSGKVMKKAGFHAIDSMNNPTAIRAAAALRKYNKYAKNNDLPQARIISGARFGHLKGMPGGFMNKTKSQHSAGMAFDLTFGKGLAHANNSKPMHIFAKFGKAEGLYWGKEIYGTHEGHHWQSNPSKRNVFRKFFKDNKLTETEVARILHADPFKPHGTLVTDQLKEFMVASAEGN